MNKALRDQDYLGHMAEAVGRIQRFTAGKNKDEFLADDLLQDGVIRNLEIIGEAASKQSRELKAQHDDVPSVQISGMRNRLIHGDMSVNPQIVWSTVEKVLPDFREKVAGILEELESRP